MHTCQWEGQQIYTIPVKVSEFLILWPVHVHPQIFNWTEDTWIIRLTEKQHCVLQFPTSTKVSPREEERKDESPASWRLGLRKTGSYGALAEITASKETQKEKDSTGVMRSASSPRLSSSLDNKDKVTFSEETT